jgi:hypothetical protein
MAATFTGDAQTSVRENQTRQHNFERRGRTDTLGTVACLAADVRSHGRRDGPDAGKMRGLDSTRRH